MLDARSVSALRSAQPPLPRIRPRPTTKSEPADARCSYERVSAIWRRKLNAEATWRDVHHDDGVIFIYHRVLRDSQQSATFTEWGRATQWAHAFPASGDRPSHRDRQIGTTGERPLPRHRAIT